MDLGVFKDISNSRLFLILMIGISLVSPGIAVIYLLKNDLFLSLSTGKLILSAVAISTPVFCIQIFIGMIAAADIFSKAETKNINSEIENEKLDEKDKERIHYTFLIIASGLTCLSFYLAFYFHLVVKKYFGSFFTALWVSVFVVSASMVYLISKESRRVNEATPRIRKKK